VEQYEAIPAAKGQHFLSPFPCGFYTGFGCHSNPPPAAGKWGEGWLPAGAEQQGSREITDFPVISLVCFRLAQANFPVSTQAANLAPPAQSHRKIHMHQERHTGSSSRFRLTTSTQAPLCSSAATRSQLEEVAPTQLDVSSVALSEARGGLGQMLPGFQQAFCLCFPKHWGLNPRLARQYSCVATSTISSCPQ